MLAIASNSLLDDSLFSFFAFFGQGGTIGDLSSGTVGVFLNGGGGGGGGGFIMALVWT